jgi:hypothetical protein
VLAGILCIDAEQKMLSGFAVAVLDVGRSGWRDEHATGLAGRQLQTCCTVSQLAVGAAGT